MSDPPFAEPTMPWMEPNGRTSRSSAAASTVMPPFPYGEGLAEPATRVR